MAYKSAETISDSEKESSEFQCPTGFKKVTGKPTPKDLSDKQVWLVQVPLNFDVSKLKSFNLAGKQGSLSLDDTSFAIKQDDVASGALKQKIRLLGSKKGNETFRISSKRISKFFKVTESVEIPAINLEKVATPKPKVKPVEGLYMRWQPMGYGASSYEEASPGVKLKEVQQAVEKGQPQEPEKKKRKRTPGKKG